MKHSFVNKWLQLHPGYKIWFIFSADETFMWWYKSFCVAFYSGRIWGAFSGGGGAEGPNTIQQDIHLNIRLAGNSPAGYLAGTILLPITQKIRQYGKNESYLTQWHTRGFQNIRLAFHYSKSVSRENSKCLHFASIQVKHIVQNRPFFPHSKQNDKMSHIWHNGIPKTSKISN